MLTTDDDAAVWIELDGIATLRHSDSARVFTTAVRFRTAAPNYVWLNTVLASPAVVCLAMGFGSGGTATLLTPAIGCGKVSRGRYGA